MQDPISDLPIHERVTTIEARCGVIVPDMQRRITTIEEQSITILTTVTETNALLKANGFGKKKTGASSDLLMLKLETKVSRWINGVLLGGIAIILTVIGIIVAIAK